jgi:uncharacterized membrane protein YphA (DoxX/SURF4 family)
MVFVMLCPTLTIELAVTELFPLMLRIVLAVAFAVHNTTELDNKFRLKVLGAVVVIVTASEPYGKLAIGVFAILPATMLPTAVTTFETLLKVNAGLPANNPPLLYCI